MRRLFTLIFPLLACAAGVFASAGSASAASSGVRDDGQFFSSETVTQADHIIQDIKSRHGKDVLVQTYASIPDNLQGKFQSLGKQKFYEQWADDIGRTQHVNGIVILATKNPGHLETVVGNETREKAFTVADKNQLVATMIASFKQQQYDDGLLAGLKFIQSRMDQNLGTAGASSYGNTSSGNAQSPAPYYPPAARTTGGGFPVGGLVCLGIGVLLIVFLIIRAFNSSRGGGGGYGGGPPPPGGYPPGGGYQQGYGPGGGYGGGGGGGFGRGILGGLLGGALGAWGYDRLSGRSGSTGFPPSTGGSASGGDFGANPNQGDTSFSGSGGDFDSSSSGGDFGSSADSGGGSTDFGSSGGDFGGGGDSGGGGGDSGGGGGDF
ncbi:MAG TPA: TPM domain-containing protein [Tepidisphaeraceae bacterium]|jgi:uncharacterized membrane protein YgcG|nr:TPM domain-containing protein [Tepidisphaeraceae bacterium]